MELRIKTQITSAAASPVEARTGEKRAFFDAVQQHHLSKRHGENGSLENTNQGLGSNLLSLNQMVRGGDPTTEVQRIMENGTPLDVAYLMILIFSTRNARGGKGEKLLAYKMFLAVLNSMPIPGLKLVRLFPHYGYWKDLFLLMELVVKKDSALDGETKDKFFTTRKEIVTTQLRSDMDIIQAHESKKESGETNVPPPKICLLAKWLPRENSSLDKKIGFVSDFAKDFFGNHSGPSGSSWESAPAACYRRSIVKLTETLKLPEVLLAAHREDGINFGMLASKATMRLRKV